MDKYSEFTEISPPLSYLSLSAECLCKVFKIFKRQAKKEYLLWEKVNLFILIHPDTWDMGEQNTINGYPVILDRTIEERESVYFLVTHISNNFVLWGQKIILNEQRKETLLSSLSPILHC